MSAETTNDAAATEAPPWSLAFNPAAAMQALSAGAAGSPSAAGAPAQGLMQLQRHWLSFLSDRFKQDADLVNRLAGCTSPVEANDALAQFWMSAVAQYQKEFTDVAELTKSAMLNAAKTPAGPAAGGSD